MNFGMKDFSRVNRFGNDLNEIIATKLGYDQKLMDAGINEADRSNSVEALTPFIQSISQTDADPETMFGSATTALQSLKRTGGPHSQRAAKEVIDVLEARMRMRADRRNSTNLKSDRYTGMVDGKLHNLGIAFDETAGTYGTPQDLGLAEQKNTGMTEYQAESLALRRDAAKLKDDEKKQKITTLDSEEKALYGSLEQRHRYTNPSIDWNKVLLGEGPAPKMKKQVKDSLFGTETTTEIEDPDIPKWAAAKDKVDNEKRANGIAFVPWRIQAWMKVHPGKPIPDGIMEISTRDASVGSGKNIPSPKGGVKIPAPQSKPKW